ncbi:MAG: DUF2235 domain-containing protein, partial [Methylacidiphilales bacterium]|nr:DUF2235 domain-containing protein [Candidatus Methylacidiphilales bacterium]
ASGWRGYRLEGDVIHMGARLYHYSTACFLAADPLGHASDMSLYRYANNDPVNGVDPSGRAGYFIDGTWYNAAGGKDGAPPSLLPEMARDYVGNGYYFAGPGGDNKDRISGATGYGVSDISANVYNKIVENYNAGDTIINMAAWSRGNVAMMQVADRIYNEGIPDLSSARRMTTTTHSYTPTGMMVSNTTTTTVYDKYLVAPRSNEKIITQMHMIDPVYAMGWPFNDIDVAYPKTIPSNVESSYAYLAGDSNVTKSWWNPFNWLENAINSAIDNRTIPSNVGSTQYFSGNHVDVAGAGQAYTRFDVYNSINVNSGNLFNNNSNMGLGK